MKLAEKRCVACNRDSIPLTKSEWEVMLEELRGWQVIDEKKLLKRIKVDNFAQSLELANIVGAVAEEQNHHPDLLVRWGALRIELWTHAVDGLTENDFILAAKIDQVIPNP